MSYPRSLSIILATLVMSLNIVSVSAASKDPTLLVKLNTQSLSSNPLFQIAPDNSCVVFIDSTGRLYSVHPDGSDSQLLSGGTLTDDTNRPLVLASATTQFAIVKNGSTFDVYFQARESKTSFKIFLYKTPINGAASPTQLFQITKPYTHVLPNVDGSKIYLAGAKHSLYDVASQQHPDLPITPVFANQFKLSSDSRWVLYLAASSATAGQFELRAYDLQNSKEKTLLQGFDQMNLQLDVSPDNTWVAVQKSSSGAQSVVLISLEGNEQYNLNPQGSSIPGATIENIHFIKGTRTDGDPGRLLYTIIIPGALRKLYVADLFDYSVVKVATGEVNGEEISDCRIAPDSKTILFGRVIPGPVSPKTFSLDLNDPNAQPIFIFQSSNTKWSFTSDNTGIVYVSTGDYFAANEIILATLDGKKKQPAFSRFSVRLGAGI